MSLKTLLWMPEGPKITFNPDHFYGDGYIIVEDLNPQKEISFKLTNAELRMLGLRCIWRSFF